MSATIHLFRNTGERRQYEDGMVIFRAGQPGDVMYVILEGEIEIVQNGHTLTRLGAG